jgi:hypothetical protein
MAGSHYPYQVPHPLYLLYTAVLGLDNGCLSWVLEVESQPFPTNHQLSQPKEPQGCLDRRGPYPQVDLHRESSAITTQDS